MFVIIGLIVHRGVIFELQDIGRNGEAGPLRRMTDSVGGRRSTTCAMTEEEVRRVTGEFGSHAEGGTEAASVR